MTIHLENGRDFVLSAPRADRERKYIQSVEVDGRPWEKTWFAHDVIANGGRVAIEMGDRPNKAWGSGEAAAPPSEGVFGR